jgi:DNA transposition AAA+ family ATPase
LLIIDESDYLSLPGFDLIRTLNDSSRIGIVLFGLPSISKKFYGKSAEVRQLVSRISMSVPLTTPDLEDVSEVLNKNWYGLDEEIKRTFFNYSGGSLRVLKHLIFHCRRSLKQNEYKGKELEVEHIEVCRSILPSLSEDE